MLNAHSPVSCLSWSTLGHLFWRCHLELAYSTYGNWQPLSNAPCVCAAMAWWRRVIISHLLRSHAHIFHSIHEKQRVGSKDVLWAIRNRSKWEVVWYMLLPVYAVNAFILQIFYSCNNKLLVSNKCFKILRVPWKIYLNIPLSSECCPLKDM